MYDPLNQVVVDSCLAPAKAYEVDLALEHLKHTQANDLLLFDRNYTSYIFLASLIKLGRQFQKKKFLRVLIRKNFFF